jgi:hypothetical protein
MVKIDWSAVWESMVKHKFWLTIIGLALLLLFVAGYLTQCGGNWMFWRGVKKDKQAIANQMQQADAVRSEIGNLQNVNAQIQTNINADTQALANQVYGREEIKAQTDQALANYQKAVNANSNVDKAAEDLNRVLEKLDQ